MAKYIEKSKLEKEILNWAICLNNPDTLSRSDALFVIDNTEAADVAPVVHGTWLLRHIGHGHYWECSICHATPIYVTNNTNYCPNCGAKMDAKQEEKQCDQIPHPSPTASAATHTPSCAPSAGNTGRKNPELPHWLACPPRY